MAGGGGALPEPGFLDIPTFTIAAVLACFLLASMIFEKVRQRGRGGRFHGNREASPVVLGQFDAESSTIVVFLT